MPVPDFESLMLPALRALSGSAGMPLSEVRACVSVSEGLTPEDMQELLSSGQPVFTNRISWAVVYVAGAGLVEKVRRGVYRLTAEGERILAQAPARIDKNVLRDYPAYVEWLERKNVRSPNKDAAPAPPDDPADTPEEALDRAARQLHGVLEADVLDRVREAAPEFLERLVVDLLIALGYGGGDAEMGRVTGRSGDGGIDGTIREDALGLDEASLQAKRYAAGQTVGEGALRDFAGAMDVKGRTKGVFVTTAGFTRAAKNYVAQSPKRIVLIDGEELARLMVKHNIGVRRKTQYEVKRIDEDYFDLEGL